MFGYGRQVPCAWISSLFPQAQRTLGLDETLFDENYPAHKRSLINKCAAPTAAWCAWRA